MYLLFERIENLNIPFYLLVKLFDNTVLHVPVLTYAYEIWGYENNDIIQKEHTDFVFFFVFFFFCEKQTNK